MKTRFKVLLLLLTLPAAVQGQYYFTTNNGAITITGYTGPGGAVTIPSTINGLPVTGIGAGAFEADGSVISVTIPNSVVSIGAEAFASITSLTWAYFQGNAPSADSTVFLYDNNLTVYYLPGTSGWSSSFAGRPAVMLDIIRVLTQPTNQVVINGGTATFSVVAGGAGPFTYQWELNGTNLADNARITGSQSNTLTIANLLIADAGNYTVSVANPWGSTDSQPAVLSVLGPTITGLYAFTNFAGLPGTSGTNDGTGSAARFHNPASVAVDSAGNVFVADSINHTIRKVTPAGVVTTLAGLGGSSGTNDRTGSAARFNLPNQVAVDSTGNVFVVEQLNNTIRKVTPAGVVTTLAGSAGNSGSADGTGGAARFKSPTGVAVDSAGNVFVADWGNDTIRKVTPAGVVTTLAGSAGASGTNDGTGNAARFYYPVSVAVDSADNVFVADGQNYTIRKVTSEGIVTTLAGSAGSSGTNDGMGSAARFYFPKGVAVDSVGNVYVADTLNDTIRKVSPVGTNWVVVTLAGSPGASGTNDGIGSAAGFNGPHGVAVDSAGNLYVADQGNSRISKGVPSIRELAPVLTWAYPAAISYGTTLGASQLNATASVPGTFSYSPPAGTAPDAGTNTLSVLFAPTDTTNYGSATATVSLVVLPASLTVTASNATRPYGATNPVFTGIIIGVTNGDNFTASYTCSATLASPSGAYLITPILSDPNNRLPNYITTTNNGTLTVTVTCPPIALTPTVLPSAVVGAAYSQSLTASGGTPPYSFTLANGALPAGLTLSASGALTGSPSAPGTNTFTATATDANGCTAYQVYAFTTTSPATYYVLNRSGGLVQVSPGGGAAISKPSPGGEGMAVDANGNFIIATAYSLVRLTPAGASSVIATAPPGSQFLDVAIDSVGNYVVSDNEMHRVVRVSPDGMAITPVTNYPVGHTNEAEDAAIRVLGNGNYLVAEDNSNSLHLYTITPDGSVATINLTGVLPQSMGGLCFDAAGNYVITDYSSNAIDLVTPAGVCSTLVQFSSSHGFAGIARDPVSGNFIVADRWQNTLCSVSPDGNSISTILSGSPLSSPVDVVVVPPVLAIATQPQSQIVDAGGTATFSVGAVGLPPLAYQWLFNGTGLPGATTPALTITNAQVTNSGSYQVLVSNGYGSLASTLATLTVLTAPVIAAQPQSQVATIGSSATFAVTGTAPFSYQWQLDGTDIVTYSITTVAGSGSGSFSGDGGAATNASLYYPDSVALEASGNLYIADSYNHRIRKVDTHGTITTVAGNGPGGFSGDGGAATNTSLYYPGGVALDAFGNLYIADFSNERIRKVSTNGIITTVAGGGGNYPGNGGAATNASLSNPSAVALDASGDLYIAEFYYNRIRKVNTNGIITTVVGNGTLGFSGDGGAATNASLYYPNGVALDASGSLYIADYYNNRIRKVDTHGIITTVAGNGSVGFSGDGGAAMNTSLYYPSGVALDTSGNLYIADTSNNRIRKVDTNGVITTVAGNGYWGFSGDGDAAGNARLYYPSGVALDASGNLYIADSDNLRIRKLTSTVYPTGIPNSAIGIGDAQAANAGSYSVIITGSGVAVTSVVATLAVTPSLAVITSQPQGGTISVGQNYTFGVVAHGTEPLSFQWQLNGANIVAASNYSLPLSNIQPTDAGSYTVVLSNALGSVTSSNALLSAIVPSSYRFTTIAGQAFYSGSANGTNSLARFNQPRGVALDSAGNVYVADTYNNTIRRIAPVGTNWVVSTIAGLAASSGSANGTNTTARFSNPYGVAADNAGNVYVADTSNQTIRKIAPLGTNWVVSTIAGLAGNSGSANGTNSVARFKQPWGVAVDSAGNVYVADSYNNTIRKVTPVGTNWVVSTIAGLAGNLGSADGTNSVARFNQPRGVAVDSGGNLFVADSVNWTIRKITPVGTNWVVSTIAGLANHGGSMDGTNSAARFSLPTGIAVDGSDNVYVMDLGNETVRMLTPVGTNWVVSTIGGFVGNRGSADGIGSVARFYDPQLMAVDAQGDLYIANTATSTIREGVPLGYAPVPYTYTTNNGMITITGYTGPGGAVTIPSMINGLPVTSIGFEAFYGCNRLTSVTISGSVTNLNDGPFTDCTSVTAITVDTNNPAYSSVAGVLFNKSQNTLIQYPAGKAGASYTIPNSVTCIGDDAFYSCTSLTGVYFWGNAPSTGSTVFSGDNNATAYYLPGTTGWSDFSANTGLPTALWLLPNPLVLNNGPSFGMQSNGFGFIISWATNIPVVVEVSTDLANPLWSPVETNTLTDGSSYFSDPQWTNHPARFYRLRSP